MLFRGWYAVQVGYIDVQEGYMLFEGVICWSGEDMLLRWVIWMF